MSFLVDIQALSALVIHDDFPIGKYCCDVLPDTLHSLTGYIGKFTIQPSGRHPLIYESLTALIGTVAKKHLLPDTFSQIFLPGSLYGGTDTVDLIVSTPAINVPMIVTDLNTALGSIHSGQ